MRANLSRQSPRCSLPSHSHVPRSTSFRCPEFHSQRRSTPRAYLQPDKDALCWQDSRAHGYPANRVHLYQAEDTLSACFFFESGIPGSGSWCFVGHESAKEDCIEVIGEKGSLSFSVFTYQPIEVITSEGKNLITVPNPPYVQLPLIKSVIQHLQGIGTCDCTSVSATAVNWVLDRVLWKN